MPLMFIKTIDKDTQIGLWRIADELHLDEVCPQSVCADIKHMCTRRQKETMAVYALLHAMTGRKDIYIRHNADGKPQLDGYNISISHTVGFAAVILSATKDVAIDVEYRNDRVLRIREKFLTPAEIAAIEGDMETTLLLCWCAKETVYKYFSEEKLAFDEMLTDISKAQSTVVNLTDEGTFYCSNLRNNTKKTIRYMQNDEFVLTYTL